MESMTDEQRYLFDLNGYLVLERVLPPEQAARMRGEMHEHGVRDAANDPSKSRFGGFLEWGPDWRELIDHPAVLPVLRGIIGGKFRLDHAYGMAMRADGARGGEGLHHEAGLYDHGCYYATHGSRMHNGLVVVSFALSDVPAGAGGFCCIPGSHKALYPLPSRWFGAYDNPLIRHVPLRAGDVVVFTEALTHGTLPWTCATHERRAVLMKFAPAYMQWAKAPIAIARPEEFTRRQLLILEGGGGMIGRQAI